MEIIFILIPIGIILVSIAIWAFFWAVKNDQFEDLDGPAHSILFDDPADQNPDQNESSTTKHESSNLDND